MVFKKGQKIEVIDNRTKCWVDAVYDRPVMFENNVVGGHVVVFDNVDTGAIVGKNSIRMSESDREYAEEKI